tara:strand:+ start:51685 stop:52203 length:519 start_codon:yes stop_codon:yes gene_type:complete
MRAPEPPADGVRASLVVVGGVSGAGKTTLGEQLAAALATPFVEGDGLHLPESIEKMSSGIPLDDEDRADWLDRVGRTLAAHSGTGLVITCSALKRRYREAILAHCPEVVFVMLTPPAELIRERLAQRTGHFMPPSLLDSQLAAFEPLAPDEHGVAVGSDIAVGELVAQAGLR